jgi:hypothetical protein
MSVVFICLHPEEALPSMLDLRLIADPSRSRQEHVTLQDVEECKQQRL